MENSYEIPNLENQKNDMGTCEKPAPFVTRKFNNSTMTVKNSPPHSEHPVSKLGVLSGVKKDFRVK